MPPPPPPPPQSLQVGKKSSPNRVKAAGQTDEHCWSEKCRRTIVEPFDIHLNNVDACVINMFIQNL